MIIQSKYVYYEERLQAKQIEIKNDKIIGIYPHGLFKVDKDYKDLIIMPGLCDVHNHGYMNKEANTATKKWLDEWTAYLPSEGVTSVLATISSHPKDGLLKALKNIGEYIDKHNKSGTHILGVYEEGPFISSGKERGAQSTAYQIIPDKKVIDEFNDACNGHLIYVMIAPEMLKDMKVIDYCVSKGMKVALGHTGASFDICKKAIEHGAISFTHTYNGMKGLHHRDPGVVGAAMYFDECYAELICDGIHVDKHAANILAKIKGKDKLILVTDAVSIKGLKPGVYIDKNGKSRTISEDGVGYITGTNTLSGSCHKLNHILDFAIHEANIDFVTAMNGVTINPMKMLGINDRGLIKENYYADIAVFDDRFNNKATYINGILYK